MACRFRTCIALSSFFRRGLGAAALALAGFGSSAALPPDHTEWSEPVFRSSYRLIASAEEWSVLDTLSRSHLAAYLNKFWKMRDPTPTTEPNEFRDQFEVRVDFAATAFRAIPPPSPWDARGDTYIRLGPPDTKGFRPPTKAPFTIPNPSPKGSRRPAVSNAPPGIGEQWYYRGYLPGGNLRVDFARGGPTMNFVPTDTTLYLDTVRVAYETPAGVERIAMAFDWYPFRRTDGDYDVYVASATPIRELARATGRTEGDLQYTGHVVAFDSTYRTVWTDSAVVDLHVDRIGRDMVALNQWQAVLPAGLYTLAAEVQDALGTKHAVASFKRWLVPYADTVELDLSPLVIAASISSADDDRTGFVRNGKNIMPMPGHVFDASQDVHFYHELYDLSPDSTGSCRYRVEYVLYGRRKHNRRLLFSDDLSSARSQTFQAGKIPCGKLHRDTYILEAKAIDLVAGTTRTALAQFTVQ